MNELEKFIFDDNVQEAFQMINNSILDFNILEITGMGTQEIKHSNILAWMFGDNNHELEHKILEKFLVKVSEYNQDTTLKHYVYLSNKKNINIFREQSNIDLLIEDEQNKIVIAIENKIYANESAGQLTKYKNYIDGKYVGWNKYFIYLTIDGTNPSDDIWLIGNYNMIAESVEEVMNNKQSNLDNKTILVLESYLDLLKRRGIVENKEIADICKKIWSNENYKKALEILFEYKPDIQIKISDILKDELSKFKEISIDSSTKNYIRFYDLDFTEDNDKGTKQWTESGRVLIYEFYNTAQNGVSLRLIVGPTNNEEYRKILLQKFNNNSKSTKWSTINTIKIINPGDIEQQSLDEIRVKIQNSLTNFFEEKGDFKRNQKKYLVTKYKELPQEALDEMDAEATRTDAILQNRKELSTHEEAKTILKERGIDTQED